MHHTKDKGDLGLAHVIYDLTKQGYFVSLPITEHSPYDLVASKGKLIYRIQVKYRTLRSNGTVEVPLRNVWVDSTKGITKGKLYSPDEVDYFAITNGDRVAYVSTAIMQTHICSITIRFVPSSNGQTSGIHLVDDFALLL